MNGQNDEHVFGASPDSSWSGSLPYSAETASLRWFGLLATDATHGFNTTLPVQDTAPVETSGIYVSQDEVSLRDDELPLFQHFVQNISPWIDLTDPEKNFAILVPQMALRNLGLMNAILALSSRHLSLTTRYAETDPHQSSDRTQAVNYYNHTLVYLQQVMSITSYLRSDELLATVLIISTYEMIDGSDRGWERHLKGVFWIQVCACAILLTLPFSTPRATKTSDRMPEIATHSWRVSRHQEVDLVSQRVSHLQSTLTVSTGGHGFDKTSGLLFENDGRY